MFDSGAGSLRADCRVCGGGPLTPIMLVDEHGIPPGEDGHNIVYGHTTIGLCPHCGSLQIERLDHDCFDYEAVWDQFEWYVLDRAALAVLRTLLSDCRNPLNPACQCTAHQLLRAECGALPSSGWASVLEAEDHVHRIRIHVTEGRLHLEPAGAPPVDKPLQR